MSGKAAALTALGTSASASSRTLRRSRSRKYAKGRAAVEPGLPTAFVRGVQKGKKRSKGKAKRQPFSKRKALKKNRYTAEKRTQAKKQGQGCREEGDKRCRRKG